MFHKIKAKLPKEEVERTNLLINNLRKGILKEKLEHDKKFKKPLI